MTKRPQLLAAFCVLLFTIILSNQASALYDPGAGRFCSRDPIGYKGSKWDLYEFAGGRSINRIDPSGLAAIEVTINAFISKIHDPDRDGWIPLDPGGILPVEVGTNNRMAGEPGTSKISKSISIDSCKIGKAAPNHQPATSSGTDIRFTIGGGGCGFGRCDPTHYDVHPSDNSGVTVTPKCKSDWSGKISAAIADIWLAPPIRLSGGVDFIAKRDAVVIKYNLKTTFFPDFEVIVTVDGERCGLGEHYTSYTHPMYGLHPHPTLASMPVNGSFTCSAKTDCKCGGTCNK